MQDFFGIFSDTSPLTQIYSGHGTDWQMWEKPRGITFVHITAVAGGGGGGTGFTAAATAARGGGGGGGSGGATRALVPALFLPDIIYVQVGTGGASTAAGLGTSLSCNRSTTGGMLILQTATGGAAGGNGTGSAAGAAGTAGAGAINTGYAAGWGLVITSGGSAGGIGGAQTGAVGVTGVTPALACLVSGGAGGAGVTTTDFAGGPETSPDTSVIPSIAGGTAAGGAGRAGYMYRGPTQGWFSLGGSGGGSNNSGVAGAGGAGGPGSGGGGGGGGATGGAGGRGGDGFVVIVCV